MTETTDLATNTTEQIACKMDEYWRMAKAISASGMVSQRSPEACLAVILKGHELGIGPMQAFQCIHHVKGKLVIEASLMEAIAIRRYNVTLTVEEWTDKVARFVFHREGWNDLTAEFTIEEAERAGLTSKDNWKMYAKDMLAARCKARGLRMIAPDVFAGTYTREEFDYGGLRSAGSSQATEDLNAVLSGQDAQPEPDAVEAEVVETEAPKEPEDLDDLGQIIAKAKALREKMKIPEDTFWTLHSSTGGAWPETLAVLEENEMWQKAHKGRRKERRPPSPIAKALAAYEGDEGDETDHTD